MNNKKKLMRAIMSHNELGALIPLALILIIVAFVNPNFFGAANLIDILRTASFSFFIGVPLTYLLTASGMDLSVGSTLSLAGVIVAYAIAGGWNMWLAILVALLAGALVGWINGVIVVRFGQPAFIITLGMQYILSGIALLWTGGLAVSGMSAEFKALGQTYLFDTIPVPILYALIIGVVGYIVLNRSKFGRSIAAIGGNPETAYLAGIPVVRRRILVYVAVGLFSAFTGVIWAARFASGIPGAGDGVNLKIMAAVIIGGTSPSGGSGTIVGTAVGCILLATITNFLILVGIPSTAQTLIFGLILILSMFIDKYRRAVLSGK